VKPRLIVYIDGYNWYHAIIKHHPEWKWLNISTFFKALRPHEGIVAIKMFSAILSLEGQTVDLSHVAPSLGRTYEAKRTQMSFRPLPLCALRC